jgi:uncharacterized protein
MNTKTKKQIILIGGGETFDTYNEYIEFLKNKEFNIEKKKKWKDSLQKRFGENFEIITPIMPSRWNAKYLEWKIWFEKVIPFIKDNATVIGGSLGGLFVAKYLSENTFPKKILATYLLAAPYDNNDSNYSLADFILPKSLSLFEKQGGKIFLYHSKDDPVVPFNTVEKYAEALPKAEKVIFENKGHFIQEEFPELIKSITSV